MDGRLSSCGVPQGFTLSHAWFIGYGALLFVACYCLFLWMYVWDTVVEYTLLDFVYCMLDLRLD